MRKSLSPSELGFTGRDRTRLSTALAKAITTRVFRRIQAVRLVAEGYGVAESAQITGVRPRTVYHLVNRYLWGHRVESLLDLPRSGRPPDAPTLTGAKILRELKCSPLQLGDRTNVWTVATLAAHLSDRYASPIAPWTLRRRMRAMKLECKRPRYFYEEKDPHRAQKKGPFSGN
jgi:transposase